ncbi:putative SOS response-associated peptidase YoqW [Paenibacillus sp. J31TS4]|uniref:SOS response-associated peptidase n=1 Tax=Paenibacillus sp. J31TS4 TaxID=2807195 RepID=UPI001B0F06E6|nr:SOS response-associated peptidase [Paenibacillus sp. J31TS4]GIP41167.1 putative SOS response-associated peptidase YoqW [Paenibacillus sp. J31TS4]
MCGRFTLTTWLEEIMERFLLEPADFPYEPRYNAAPGQWIPAIVEHEGKRRIGQLRWGLVPSWAQDEKIGYKMINAKSETAADKPSFRTALQRRRCLIPADGFYEWRRNADGTKQPLRFVRNDRALFAMAGLYDTWQGPDGKRIGTCTILTTSPNALVEPVHNRMPVILDPTNEAAWLDKALRDPAVLQPMLAPYPAEEMTAYPVSPDVGNVKNDTAACTLEWQ